jgi:hypothetical protein
LETFQDYIKKDKINEFDKLESTHTYKFNKYMPQGYIFLTNALKFKIQEE